MPAVPFTWNRGSLWGLRAVGFRLDPCTFLVDRRAADVKGPCVTGPAPPPVLSSRNAS